MQAHHSPFSIGEGRGRLEVSRTGCRSWARAGNHPAEEAVLPDTLHETSATHVVQDVVNSVSLILDTSWSQRVTVDHKMLNHVAHGGWNLRVQDDPVQLLADFAQLRTFVTLCFYADFPVRIFIPYGPPLSPALHAGADRRLEYPPHYRALCECRDTASVSARLIHRQIACPTAACLRLAEGGAVSLFP